MIWPDSIKGVYTLVVKVPQTISIEVGALGILTFVEGNWVYVGSAMGTGSTSLGGRLKRHFSKIKKKHWHIDYLLERTFLKYSIWAESDNRHECNLANLLKIDPAFELGPIGFGSSDCRNRCGTHIFYFKGKEIVTALKTKFESLGLDSSVLIAIENQLNRHY